VNAALLATTGFFIGGPSNMISSAISADLGRQEALRGSQEALATVTGIVDGTGSIGAAAGQVTHTRDRESTHIHTVHAYTQKYVLSSDLMLSFFSLVFQYLVSVIESKLGWMFVFYFFIVMVISSCLTP
jgi:OPA family glycerol-3-phosphate transporter-like MFS transporter 3